jgi:hypothetical protein
MSTTTISDVQYLQDYGTNYAPGTATHHLTLYKHPSGALVFGAGTIQWSWGLDDTHDFAGTPTDPSMQQATVNLFADMGVQPATLMAGLQPATASADTTPPTASITSPAAGAHPVDGTQVAVTGTASDVGGQVGGVEVSADGGATWHPATAHSSWTYLWTPSLVGSQSLTARAVDDSGNRFLGDGDGDDQPSRTGDGCSGGDHHHLGLARLGKRQHRSHRVAGTAHDHDHVASRRDGGGALFHDARRHGRNPAIHLVDRERNASRGAHPSRRHGTDLRYAVDDGSLQLHRHGHRGR